jgi:hypothetical protein
MRAAAVLFVALVGAGWAAPASAEPALLLIGTEAERRVVRLADATDFSQDCRPAPPPAGPTIPVPDIQVWVGGALVDTLGGVEDRQGNIYLAGTTGELAPRGQFCVAGRSLNERLYAAAALPSKRWAWTVFWVAMAGLAAAIGLVAVSGLGVGPEPIIETSPDPHDEPQEAEAH